VISSSAGGYTLPALPLNGRSFITLSSLVPGVALPQGSQFPRINGGRPRTNQYLFDGLSVLQPVLHGTAFEFFRHESLNARNFFQTSNATKPKFSRNQFGAVLGGPLLRNRTLFFVDYQGQRQA
jgi:hypothetical protein